MDNNIKVPKDFKIEPKTELGKKLDNFWFYHKWKVIVGIFLVIAITVCTVQCMSKEKTDVQILYAGGISSSNAISQDMKSALSDIKPKELGENGTGLTVLELYSDKYVIENQDKVNAYNNSQNYKDFCQLLTAGEYSLLILDKWIYDDIKTSVGFRKITEVVGNDVVSDDAMYDDSAIYLKKTDFYLRYYGTFSKLPDDTVICLCIYSPYKSTVGCASQNSDSAYDASVEMFKAIVNYKG